MITLSNEFVQVKIKTLGAELTQILDKSTNRDYLWDMHSSWQRQSPLLFPNIGGLAEEVLIYDGKEYPALAHGFARDMEFSIVENTDTKACLALSSNEDTNKYYPFKFTLFVEYIIKDKELSVIWRVENQDNVKLPFSIGAHPAFMFDEDTNICDYTVKLDKTVKLETRRVLGRYMSQEAELIAQNTNELKLSAELFAKDALVFEDSGINRMTLVNNKTNYGLQVEFEGFPVVALWTETKQADNPRFLCIEPWHGINATIGDTAKDIYLKDRITIIDKNEVFESIYKIKIIG